MLMETIETPIIVVDPKLMDPEPDKKPPHERCLRDRDGHCVI
jgi:hypothetical protein